MAKERGCCERVASRWLKRKKGGKVGVLGNRLVAAVDGIRDCELDFPCTFVPVRFFISVAIAAE